MLTKSEQQRIKKAVSGEPTSNLTYHGNGYAKDEQGRVFKLVSAEHSELRARIARQKAEGRKESFVFNVMDSLPFVASSLTSAQCGYLLVLSTYIQYGSDGLIVKSERSYSPMTQNDMLKALRMRESQRSTLTDFLTTCIDYGIMRITDDGGYAINDAIHLRGAAPNDRVVRSFVAKLREMASENKPEQLGFIYSLLPAIHKTTNILCANPNEANPGKVSHLNRKQIAELAGVSPRYVTTLTGQMVYRGKSVFAKITTATSGTFYMLNPAIFRRADRLDYDVSTRGIFGIE